MCIKTVLFSLPFFLVFSQSAVTSAGTWYVNGGEVEFRDGQSLETGFEMIQEGIDAATDGDTVIVAQGTYVENIEFKGKNIVLTTTDPTNADTVENSIIDGSEAGSVVTFAGTENETCILSGFTIRNGTGTEVLFDSTPVRVGGGIFGGVPGGDYAHATIENNIISGNSADGGGGLSWCDGLIKENMISENSASSFGGGFYFCDGTIRNNVISGNSANGNGGGLVRCDGTIHGNMIIGNSASDSGGGVQTCHGAIQNNTISGNSAERGGGINSSLAAIQSNAILGNRAEESGGGLHWCFGTIQNNTIAGNRAGQSGGGLHECAVYEEYVATIRNCIIWGNEAPNYPQLYNSSTPSYSCIQGWTGGGEGNIDRDPLFADPNGPDEDPHTYEDNDYHLLPQSPCIDKGKDEDWMWGAVDLDGNPRISRGTVDMGGYEYLFEVIGTDGGEVQLRWSSRPDVVYMVWSCHDLLTGTWEKEVAVVSTGASTSCTFPPPIGRTKFYRVELGQ